MNSSNDTAWFMEQVGREQSRLRAFIRSLGVRAEAVDDLAQDALLVAYQRLEVFRRDEDFGAWVRGIARRLVANALRKESRRQQILSDHVTELLVAAGPEDLHPLAEAAEEDRLAALRCCLEKVPESARRLLHLRYFEEVTPGVIAGRLERSATDVRQQLFRLRRELLECIERRLSAASGRRRRVNQPAREPWEVALARWLDGEPEPGDGDLLAAALRQDPAALREVSGLLAVDELLQQHAELTPGSFQDALAERLAASADQTFVRHMQKSLPTRSHLRWPRGWRYAALAAIAAGIALLAFFTRSGSPPEVATLLLAEKCEWLAPVSRRKASDW